MSGAKKNLIPNWQSLLSKPLIRDILELDRFSELSLREWSAASQNLDELEAVLYFHLEPERRKLRSQLIESLQKVKLQQFKIKNWIRLVDYQFSNEPLSCAVSLCSPEGGGRFNVGIELDPGTLHPWPALYLAQDHETAYREKFQMECRGSVDGLSPDELALNPGINYTALSLNGELHRVFNLNSDEFVAGLALILSKIKMPQRAKELAKKLKISRKKLFMVRNSEQVRSMVLKNNWRTLPIQFGLPSHSHILAELIKAAGYEAILYKSTKGPGNCLAVFPSQMDQRSYVEVAGKVLPSVKHKKLDLHSAKELEGWQYTPRRFHPPS